MNQSKQSGMSEEINNPLPRWMIKKLEALMDECLITDLAKRNLFKRWAQIGYNLSQPSTAGDDVVFTLDQLRNAYYAGFNQAHYGHMHPDVCPPKECESAGIEYANNNLKNGVPLSSLIPARVSEEVVKALREINELCGTVNFSSHNQMREAIEGAVELSENALSLIPDSKEQEPK